MTSAAVRIRKPAYYHGWNIVIACILSQLAALGVTLNCFSLFLPAWTSEFHTPISALALGVTIFSLGCAVCAIPAGMAAEFGPRAFGRAYGVISASTPIGAIAPPIVAWTFEQRGDHAPSLIGLAAIALAGGIAALLAMRARR